jgi:hypothetical protein
MKAIATLGLLSFVLTAPAAGYANERTYDECQQLAISRGIPIKRTHPNRYVMLKGWGEKTNPKGFMARCMAGL